jgi:ATP adenylyltransferase
MDRIWAPWRMAYLANSAEDDRCILCRARDAENDREELVLFRSSNYILMLNRYPYVNGHLMAVPLHHTGNLQELSSNELFDLMEGVRLGQNLLDRAAKPDGYNIGINIGKAAGGGVEDHLHVHIVPRWNGDNNFMAVLADVRVIPEGLLECYDRLSATLGTMQ